MLYTFCLVYWIISYFISLLFVILMNLLSLWLEHQNKKISKKICMLIDFYTFFFFHLCNVCPTMSLFLVRITKPLTHLYCTWTSGWSRCHRPQCFFTRLLCTWHGYKKNCCNLGCSNKYKPTKVVQFANSFLCRQLENRIKAPHTRSILLSNIPHCTTLLILYGQYWCKNPLLNYWYQLYCLNKIECVWATLVGAGLHTFLNSCLCISFFFVTILSTAKACENPSTL